MDVSLLDVIDLSFSSLSVLLGSSHKDTIALTLFPDFKFKNRLIQGMNSGDPQALNGASRLVNASTSIEQVRDYCVVLIDTL